MELSAALLPLTAVAAVADTVEAWLGEHVLAEATVIGLRILLIIVLAVVAHGVLLRLIKRSTRSMKERGVQRLARLRGRGRPGDSGELDLQRASMRTETIGGVLRSVSGLTIALIAAMLVLGEFGVSLGPLIAGAGVAGVALGFGAQKLVQDVLSGLFMLIEDQYGINDVVDVGEAIGTIEGISLRTTRLRDIYGTLWHVPNGEIRRVGNMSQEWAQALLDVSVAYGTDVDTAAAVMLRAAEDLRAEQDWAPLCYDDPSIWGVQDLAEDGVVIRLAVRVAPLSQWQVERELRRRIKQAFDAAGIEIPFPQRTIWTRRDEPTLGPRDPREIPGSSDLSHTEGAASSKGARGDYGNVEEWGEPEHGSL